MTPADAKLNSEMEQGKSAMWHANVGVRSGISKRGQSETQACRGRREAGKQVAEEEMAVEGSWWGGDCVTGKKVHCVVCNALKADMNTHGSTHAAAAFTSPVLVYSSHPAPSLPY